MFAIPLHKNPSGQIFQESEPLFY